MTLVLAAVGLFVYLRLEDQLDVSIDQGLRSRAGEVSALIRGSGGGLERAAKGALIEQDESFAQIARADGEVVDSTPQLAGSAVLSPAEAGRAAREPILLERDGLAGVEGTARLLAAPVDTAGESREPLVVVVGSSLEDSHEALSSLARLLAIGGPVALLLASLAGYGAAAAALRPVEAMRRRAAAISADGPDQRLPVPAARDEIARLGETLNRMLGRLETGLERERRFVDDASHELRTPLALHKTELELALRYGNDEAELRAAISSAIAEIDRLIQLAEDLLVVARTEGGRLAVTLERVPVGQLLETVRQRFQSRAEGLGRPLVVEAAEGLAVEGDRLRLEQAMTSVVDNALRYGEGEVRLWAREGEGLTALHVSDRGPGFPAEFIDRAFERFATADSGRGGSGLGLAIVETIARAHGGSCGASNDSGGGADVWIEVPSATS